MFTKGNKLGIGRPKKDICIPDILREIEARPVTLVMLAKLRAKWGPDFKPRNNREAMLMVCMAQAHEGDANAREFIANRTEGKVTDKLILDDQTPREVVFREERLGDYSIKTPVAVVRTIIRSKPDA